MRVTNEQLNKMLKTGNTKVRNRSSNKYKNVKVWEDGVLFDSKKEKDRYVILKLLEKAGELSELKLQARYEIFPGYKHNGKKIQAIHYLPDFVYTDKSGKVIAEDVKSEATRKNEVYRLKKKMFVKKYILDLGEVDEFNEI